MLIIALFIMSFSILANKTQYSSQEQLISRVESLFKEDPETLNYNEVINLSNEIIVHREKYPSEVLAKTYLLLATVASNKGELETALQLVQDGLDAVSPHDKTKLCLQIKLASILFAQERYDVLLTIAEQAINMPHDKENSQYFLLALSYRSVAFAMLNQYENALNDLQQVDAIIKKNPSFAEHISVLAILANAYSYLGDHQTALTMQLKILKLRFNSNKLSSVEQTYYHLANAYYRLERFNDAYNAYWEAKKYAKEKKFPIYIAYASQGLGLTLTKQKQYLEAKIEIQEAKTLFYQHNLAQPYVETMISLALLYNLTEQPNEAVNLLLEAEESAENIQLTADYIILYQLLANVYFDKMDNAKAYFWQKKYSDSLLIENKAKIPNLHFFTEHSINNSLLTNSPASNQTRQLAMKITEQSELSTTFSQKYQQQQVFIYILSCFVLFLLSLGTFLWLRHRAKKLKKTYDALEKPNDMIATPLQTKQLYQKSFNMARKYSYPLTLGYIAISNWQELTFKFNKRISADVSREIASLLNKHINEFEKVGLINEGEYLLIFPHQTKAEVALTMEKIVLAFKSRFFANLGEFSVTITYSIESPNFQDIDPYIFLSQLSDSIKIA